MYDWLVPLFFPSGIPTGIDLDDPQQCVEVALSAATAGRSTESEAARAAVATRRIVATQLLAGEPAELLEAAQLLVSEGRTPQQTWAALDTAFDDALEYSSDPDAVLDVFRANLELLPLPDDDEIAATYLDFAASPIPLDDLEEAVSHRLAMDLEVPMVRSVLEAVQDRLLNDQSLALLTGDIAVVPERVLSGVVLTTRLRSADELVLDADLAPFTLLPEPEQTRTGGALDVEIRADGRLVWRGPRGWLVNIEPGTLIAVRCDGPEVVVEPIEANAEPSPDPHLIAALAELYEQEVEEVGLPVPVGDLVVGLRVADSERFSTPTAPLSELCAAADLEVRGTAVGRGSQVWAVRRWSTLLHESFALFATEDERPQGLIKLMGTLAHGEQPSTEEVRAGLAALAEPDLTLDLIRLLDDDDDPETTSDLVALVDVLRSSATRARWRAAVTWLRARVAARSDEPVQAESLLREVLLDDPDNADAIDELAWYASDRGDAEKARSLWLQLEEPPQADLALLPEPSTGGPKLRRNEPCWCGSGRKYKACHLNTTERPPLPDRFHWMLRKLFSYFERRGGAAARDLARAAWLLELQGEQTVERVWSDPVALDVVLFEFGWLGRFLAARGALLPDDERLLYASWQLRGRSLYEVTEVNPGAGTARLRDLRTGDEEELLDRLFSSSTRVGTLICARLLHDGERTQLCDGGFDVPVGREGPLLELLDLEDPQERGEALLSWHAARSRPPTLQTREGEPLSRCWARLSLVNSSDAAEFLDAAYEDAGDDRWVENHQLTPEESIVRATLTLQGDELLVETSSERRLERTVEALLEALPGTEVLDEEREPVSFDDVSTTSPPILDLTDPEPDPPSDETRAVLQEIVESHELRWCGESVPALGGLTPREAAADPTRREQLERLLASMPEGGVNPLGIATMRPARLRELLGLG